MSLEFRHAHAEVPAIVCYAVRRCLIRVSSSHHIYETLPGIHRLGSPFAFSSMILTQSLYVLTVLAAASIAGAANHWTVEAAQRAGLFSILDSSDESQVRNRP